MPLFLKTLNCVDLYSQKRIGYIQGVSKNTPKIDLNFKSSECFFRHPLRLIEEKNESQDVLVVERVAHEGSVGVADGLTHSPGSSSGSVESGELVKCMR